MDQSCRAEMHPINRSSLMCGKDQKGQTAWSLYSSYTAEMVKVTKYHLMFSTVPLEWN